VILQFAQRPNDGVEGFPTPCGPARAAINNQLVGIFRDLGIEIVHQHPQRGFLMPSFATEFIPAWCANRSFLGHSESSALSKRPFRIASATRSISVESARSSSTRGVMPHTLVT